MFNCAALDEREKFHWKTRWKSGKLGWAISFEVCMMIVSATDRRSLSSISSNLHPISGEVAAWCASCDPFITFAFVSSVIFASLCALTSHPTQFSKQHCCHCSFRRNPNISKVISPAAPKFLLCYENEKEVTDISLRTSRGELFNFAVAPHELDGIVRESRDW